MCQFDLQFALQAVCALGKNVENQLASIDHLDFEAFLQIALLGWGKRIVEQDDIGSERSDQVVDFGDLAGSNVGCGSDPFDRLNDFTDNLDTGCICQTLEFCE